MTLRTEDREQGRTLVDILRRAATGRPDRGGYTFLADGETESARLSLAELDVRARALAVGLRQHAAPGDRAVLLYPPGLEFLVGLFGSLYAGLVAVPAYAPRGSRSDPRLRAIVEDCGAHLALLSGAGAPGLARSLDRHPELKSLCLFDTDHVTGDGADGWQPPALDADTLAILQYTSGSTGTPRGVELTHGNLLHNLHDMVQVLGLDRAGCGVCWLPAFHDMGLIGNLLQAVYTQCPLVVMPPVAFVQKPIRWLRAVSRYRAYVSGGPNFAFELCARKVAPEERAGLDLSCWQVAYVGAEPISPDTLDRFAEAFAPCGFRREAFLPCYGLAESTLMVSGERTTPTPLVLPVDRARLERHEVAPPANDEARKLVVGCGGPVDGLGVRVVDAATGLPCPAGSVGEIWVSGPSVGRGYWNRPEESEQTFRARIPGDDAAYLRTGDLGFVSNGHVFVTGRIKDVIIVRGRNYYPQDIENVIEGCHPALRPASGAAFAVEEEGEPRLVIAWELEREHRNCDGEAVAGAVRQAVADSCELETHAVVLVRPASIPKTSSGKIQRNECQRAYLAGELEVAHLWKRERFPAESAESAEESQKEKKEAGSDRSATAPPDSPSSLSSSSSALSALSAVNQSQIETWLKARVARHANLPPERIDPAQPFAWYGLDSVTVVAISAELEAWLGRKLSPTLLYDAPTIEALASALSAETAGVNPTARGGASGLDGAQGPIAVIGVACRFPGADNPAEFWKLLTEGREGVGELPEGHWQTVPDGLATRRGGWVGGVDRFDPQFFGIAPREAAHIDPQHRFLLERAWEALEDAALPPEKLAGGRVGVFVGISNGDYGRLLLGAGLVSPFLGTGNAQSMAANRLSYHLDLRGPSVAVDTACSSSLVAVHLACQALRRGECELALAGGVNLILAPEVSLALSQAEMLSPEGRCKTFDAAADGYVRGEGCGVVLLKPLAKALADGDRIYAVLRGSAINQDGRSNGITAPNGLSQVALLRAALHDAGVPAAAVGYIETHGTGTALGDPIEFGALQTALGEGDMPCALGAVKANIGHLESAAGIAGLIKAVLALHHGEIPPHPHLKEVNPRIGLAGTRFHIPTRRQPWPRGKLPRIAGVSSFGFGGANAHVILEEAPAVEPAQKPDFSEKPGLSADRPAHLLTLSAKSEAALRELAGRYRDFLAAAPDAVLGDVCYTAAVGRSHFAHRLAVAGSSAEEMRQALDDFAAGRPAAGLQRGHVRERETVKVAFLFTGQGAHAAGVGRQLYASCLPFREAVDRCGGLLKGHMDRPLTEVLFAEGAGASLLEETAYGQPALVALEYALAETWRAWGVEPAAVIGHSLGEYAAAILAGVFRLEDGLWLAAERGRLMQELADDGEMAAVSAPAEEVAPRLAACAGRVVIAAVNGPRNTVVSGVRTAVRAFCRDVERDGISARLLGAGRAFHSPLIEPALGRFEKAAEGVTLSAPRIPLISNLTGKPAGDEIRTAAYWRRHAREAVQFAAGAQALAAAGATVFLEVGPAAVLSALGQSNVAAGAWIASLQKGRDDWKSLLDAAARLYVSGVRLDAAAFERGHARRRVALPTYPFDRKRCWFEAPVPAVAPAPAAPAHAAGEKAALCRCQTEARRKGEHREKANGHVGKTADAALRQEFDRLASAYVAGALAKRGWQPRPGERATPDALATRLGVLPRYRRLLGRMLEMLAEDGWLRRDGDAWEVCEAPPAEDTAALLASLRSRFPAAAAELSLAGRCGERLAEVLHGTENPLQVLFPDGSFAALERVYRDSPFARQANALAAEAVAEAAAALPAGRPLRLVELGAGTGGLTAHVLPKLPDDAEYHFTDVSHLFLASAREKFREFPGVRCGILDLERSPAEQGYAPHSFDVVLAANVFHATADLRRSLRHARELLAPNGLLVLIEGTGRRRLLDLVFGLTEGWWKFADTDLRPDYPLISAWRWLDLLRAEGFTGAEVRPALGDGPEPDQVTVIARGPATANGVRPAVNGHRKTEAAAPAEAKKLAPSADRPSRKALLAANPSERRAMLTRYFRTQLGQVLGMAADDVDVDAPVNGLGLDSLMAIQLRNRVEEELSLTVPLVAFLQGLSVAQLVEKAAEQLAEAEEAPAADAEPPSVETLLARVEGMSEDEVNAALRALTTREGRPRRPVGKNGH